MFVSGVAWSSLIESDRLSNFVPRQKVCHSFSTRVSFSRTVSLMSRSKQHSRVSQNIYSEPYPSLFIIIRADIRSQSTIKRFYIVSVVKQQSSVHINANWAHEWPHVAQRHWPSSHREKKKSSKALLIRLKLCPLYY